MAAPSDSDRSLRFARFFYRWRWPASALVLGAIALAVSIGFGRVGWLTQSLGKLGDTTNGASTVTPLVFDPNLDIWFGQEDAAVRTYYEVEDRFVAEDFVMVTFEAPPEAGELGVFSRDSLATIARLTERFLTVPGVRHVRSLTYNPWIRWGSIEDEEGSEPGLIISDLVEGDPHALSDAELVERMVAVLGARRAAERVGLERVREVIGADAQLDDFIGEPLLTGTIVDESGSTTAIQVQVLRPHVDEELAAAVLGDDERAQVTVPHLYSVQFQRAALRGIRHFLLREHGLVVDSAERRQLARDIEALEEGERKRELQVALADPTRTFISAPNGERVRKYFEYEPAGEGRFVDSSDPAAPAEAPAGFEPQALSPYSYHLGGVPLFELNFEQVGMADAKYVPIMFFVIALALAFVFRNVAGVAVPMIVVFASIAGMVGSAFAVGDLFNNLTMMAPNMVTAVGIADAIHIVAAWAALRGQFDTQRELLTEVLRRHALPVFLTTLTTAVGFYSLTVSALEPVTMLGYTAGLGTLLAYALSMTVVPALLSLVPLRRGSDAPGSRLARFFSKARSDRFVERVVRRRVPILAAALTVVAVAFFGLTRVEIDTDFRGMFPDDNPTMADFRWIESRLGGVGDLEILFTGVGEAGPDAEALTFAQEERLAELRLRELGQRERPQEFAPLSTDEAGELADLAARESAWNAARIGVSPGFLGELDAFEGRLREEMRQPGSVLSVVTDLISPLDILRKMHQVQNENRAEYYRVPGEGDVPEAARSPVLTYDEWSEEWSFTPAQTAASLAAQYYLQYENGARPGENLTTQLSADRTRFRMQARVRQAPSSAHRAAFARIEEIAAEEFPGLGARLGGEQEPASAGTERHSDLTISGKSLLFARTTHMFTVGFIQSMSIALAVITLLISFIFRSLRLGVVSLIPNVLPIVTPLSFFGLVGLPLHGPAILVSSVALGVCVDDTIHFLTKFVRARRRGSSIDDSLSYVLQESGAALTITTGVLVLGFAMLLFSDFTPNFMMGTLATFMIALAWVADFLVTPAVLSLFDRTEPAVLESGEGVAMRAARAAP